MIEITCEELIARIKKWEDYKKASEAARRLGETFPPPDDLEPIGRWERIGSCFHDGCRESEGIIQCTLAVDVGEASYEKAWEGWCSTHGWYRAEDCADGTAFEQLPGKPVVKVNEKVLLWL